MDTVIKIEEDKITINLFWNPSDGHQYLHYDSCHAEQIKRSIALSQILRLKRIRFEKRDLDSNVENLREWFRKGGYPEQLIKNQVARALLSSSNNSANRSKQEKETGIPLVTTYHPRLKDLSSLIKRNLQYLCADQEVKKVFTSAPFVFIQENQKFKKFLVKVKILPFWEKNRFWKM